MTDSPGAKALRAAGYVKCPCWWVTQEQYELIHYMALKNKEDVDRIRDRARRNTERMPNYYSL